MNEEAKAQLAAITSGPSTRLREIVAGVDAMMTPRDVVQVPSELLRAVVSEVDGLRLALRGFIEGLERATAEAHRLQSKLVKLDDFLDDNDHTPTNYGTVAMQIKEALRD